MCATDLFPSQADLHRAFCHQRFLVLPFSQFGLTLFRLEKQAARCGAEDTATGLTPSKD
jgi:hypothetical protein